MRRLSYLFAVISLLMCAGFSIQAQTGTIDMMPSINNTINNEINMRRAEIYAGRSAGGSRSSKSAETIRGESIIKSGKAKNTFVSSLAGTQQSVKSSKFDADEPQDAVGQLRLIQSQVAQFNDLMRQNKLVINDVADGVALAYALSYMAAYDRNPDPQEMKQYRAAKRAEFLQNGYFQGDSNLKKQLFYEANAIMSVQAINYRMKARQTTSKQEKQRLEERAKHFAERMLQ